MPLEKATRYVYNKKPLEQVILQLRFPPILKLDTEIPALFQDKIIGEFPIYSKSVDIQQEFNLELDPSGNPLTPSAKVNTTDNHIFTSKDGNWKIGLTRTYMSISTNQYFKWEDFLEKFKIPLKAFNEIYNPVYYTRIGLRYTDVFCRSKFGLDNTVKWSELLNTKFLGVLSDDDLKESVCNYSSAFELKLKDENGNSKAIIITNLVKNQAGERCVLIDSDFFTVENIEKEKFEKQADFLHSHSTQLLQRVITDKLHDAMEPEKI